MISSVRFEEVWDLDLDLERERDRRRRGFRELRGVSRGSWCRSRSRSLSRAGVRFVFVWHSRCSLTVRDRRTEELGMRAVAVGRRTRADAGAGVASTAAGAGGGCSMTAGRGGLGDLDLDLDLLRLRSRSRSRSRVER